MAKPALGKGLGALIGKPGGSNAAGSTTAFVAVPPPLTAPQPTDEVVRKVPLNDVTPSPLQPRKSFPLGQLGELMESIREKGIMQPLIVRQRNGKFELIAGERRWRASRELGLPEVPVIVREASDQDVLELALIENLQREDLNPIEEAEAYSRLSKEFGLRQEDIAQRVGKNRATVANAIRLLDLPGQAQQFLREGRLSPGHAKVLLSLKTPEDMETAAQTIVDQGLVVKATEKLVKTILNPPVAAPKPAAPGVAMAHALREVEQKLTRHFSTAVVVSHGEKKGRVEIDYYGVDDLNRLLNIMGVAEEDFGG